MSLPIYKVIDNRLIAFISSKFISMTIPPIIGLYYITLDLWGSEWSILKDHKDIHSLIFSCLITATIIIVFIKGIFEAYKSRTLNKYKNLMESLISFFNTLVKKKRDRFFHKAKHLKRTDDIFKNITHPRDQLEHVLDGTRTLLNQGFGINSKNIGITIIQRSSNKKSWFYFLKCDSQKRHTSANTLMNGESAAKFCVDSGDSLFIPDIRKGIEDHIFFESERSKKTKLGSVFCKPVRISVNNNEYIYIFTISVYGQLLCTPTDDIDCKACEKILDEVADRVELELYLYSIKQYREHGAI